MSLKVAIQMDPVEALDPEVDTTVMMALSAQARGHRLWWYAPQSLAMGSPKSSIFRPWTSS
jgi:glutathione synthase